MTMAGRGRWIEGDRRRPRGALVPINSSIGDAFERRRKRLAQAERDENVADMVDYLVRQRQEAEEAEEARPVWGGHAVQEPAAQGPSLASRVLGYVTKPYKTFGLPGADTAEAGLGKVRSGLGTVLGLPARGIKALDESRLNPQIDTPWPQIPQNIKIPLIEGLLTGGLAGAQSLRGVQQLAAPQKTLSYLKPGATASRLTPTPVGKAIAEIIEPAARLEEQVSLGVGAVAGRARGVTRATRKAWQQKRLFSHPMIFGQASDAAPDIKAVLDEFTDVTFGSMDASRLEIEAALEEARERVGQGVLRPGIYELLRGEARAGSLFPRRMRTLADLDTSILETRIQAKVDKGEVGDLHTAAWEAIQDESTRLGLPKPTPPPALASQLGPAPDDSAGWLFRMLDRPPGEDKERAIMRKFSGARTLRAARIHNFTLEGNKRLRELGIGRPVEGGQLVERTPEAEQLYVALHRREREAVPDGWEPIYDEIVAMLDEEQAATLAMERHLGRYVMFEPAYFPQLWKGPERAIAGPAGRRKGPGTIPFFMHLRHGTFEELLAAGAEPRSWNAYEMAAQRMMAGVERREGLVLLDRLGASKMKASKARVEKAWDDDVAAGLSVDDEGSHYAKYAGWRNPDIGAPFSSVAYVKKNGEHAYTSPQMVPDALAGELESIYGKATTFKEGTKPETTLEWIERFGTGAKRLKLIGSLFQHLDFMTRTAGVAFTPTALLRGAPLRYPSLFWRVLKATASPSSRKAIRERLTSKEILAVANGQNIDMEMLVAEGMSTVDVTMIGRPMSLMAGQISKEAPAGMRGLVTSRVKALNRFVESSLFEVMYPEAEIFALENFILPKIIRSNPSFTARQVAGQAARDVNVMFSTLGPWQSVFRSPNMRALTRALIFSSNETESWMRAFMGTFRGPTKGLWAEYWLGLFTFMAATAESINYASTGQFMPLKSFLPVTSDSHGFLGMNYGYNTRFLAPKLPFQGRGGVDLFLDVMGQADTPMRWITNPPAALAARYNVLPRAILNQAQGKSFYGDKLESITDRFRQFAEDALMPIGIGNAVEMVRSLDNRVARALPGRDERVGLAGSITQIAGPNVMAENNDELLDRYAQRYTFTDRASGEPIKEWDKLEPHQVKQVLEENPDLGEELDRRTHTAAARHQTEGEASQELNEAREERILDEENLEEQWEMGDVRSGSQFRSHLKNIQLVYATKRANIDKRYAIFNTDPEKFKDQPLQLALFQYYQTFKKIQAQSARKPGAVSFVFEWDALEEALDNLEEQWTPMQAKYVQDNIHLAEHPPLVMEYLKDRRRYKYYFEVDKSILKHDLGRIAERRRYASASGDYRSALEEMNPWLPNVQGVISDVRKTLREGDYELAKFLFQFYGNEMPEKWSSPELRLELHPWEGKEVASFASA
jgi:hypothetical protein